MHAPKKLVWIVLWGTSVGAGADYATHGDARLAGLIEEALARNPGIEAAAWNQAAARENVATAGALSDPVLQVTGYGRSPQTRVGPQTTGLAVTQQLPWFGKLADRSNVAAAQAAVRQAQAASRRAEVVRQVKVSYHELGYLDRAIALTEEERQLLDHYESLARARYSQGVGLQQAVVRLQAQITRVLNRRQDLLRQRVARESGLNALRNRPARLPIADVRPGKRPSAGIDYDRLRAIARASNPELTAASLTLDEHETSVRLARRRHWPDLAIGASWGRIRGRDDDPGRSNPPPDNGRDTLGLTLGINIPLHRDIYDAGVREALARRAAAEARYRDAQNGVDGRVRSIGYTLTTIDAQIALFEDALIPQAEQALGATEEAYATGTTGVLDLLDSEEVLLDVRLGLARLETDYMQALADMERAIGSPFPPRSQQ